MLATTLRNVCAFSDVVCLRVRQMCLSWTRTSWKMRRSTKPSKEVRMSGNSLCQCPVSSLPSQSDQSSVTSRQISWMRAVATPGRRETAAMTMKRMMMKTRRRQKVRQEHLILQEIQTTVVSMCSNLKCLALR